MLRGFLLIVLFNIFLFASATSRLDNVEAKNSELQKELQEQIVNLKVKDNEIDYLKNSLENIKSKLNDNLIDVKTYDTKIDGFDKRISDINFSLVGWGLLLTILLVAIAIKYSKAAKREAKEVIEEWIKKEASGALEDKIDSHLKNDKKSYIESHIQQQIDSTVSIEIKRLNAIIEDLKDKVKEGKEEIDDFKQIKAQMLLSVTTDIPTKEDIKNSKEKTIQQKSVKDYYNLGIEAIKQEDYNEAIFNFEQALMLDDDLEQDKIYFSLGNAYYYKKEYDRAIEAYKRSIDINPDYKVYNNIGITYAKKENYKQAINYYKKSIVNNPNNSNSFYNLALSYKKINDCKNALKNYKKALKYDKNSYFSYINIGNIYFDVNKYESAIKYYKKAIRIDDKKYQAYYNLGNIHYEKKDFKNAIIYYKEAIKKVPKIQAAYLDLFELQLIQNLPIDKELEKQYLSLSSDTKENRIKYDMLKVFENISKCKENGLNEWLEKYKDVTIGGWSFNELKEWINNYENKEIKEKLLEALDIFENHKA